MVNIVIYDLSQMRSVAPIHHFTTYVGFPFCYALLVKYLQYSAVITGKRIRGICDSCTSCMSASNRWLACYRMPLFSLRYHRKPYIRHGRPQYSLFMFAHLSTHLSAQKYSVDLRSAIYKGVDICESIYHCVFLDAMLHQPMTSQAVTCSLFAYVLGTSVELGKHIKETK